MDDPQSFLKISIHPRWRAPMTQVYDSIIKNNTRELVNLPPRKNVLSNKWVFKTKLVVNKDVEKLKV